MQPQNMRFMLFLLDSRPDEALRASLEEMLGGTFEQDRKAKADGVLRFTNYLLGLNLSYRFEESWQEGRVYRFTGTNAADCRFDTLEEMDIGFHVQKILEGAGLLRVMTLEEFREESIRRES
jgi:hypothetical protein